MAGDKNNILKEHRLINSQEILDNAYTPEWLVHGLIHEESCIFLNGAAKTGKTLFGLRLAGAVSTGANFAGQATQQGRVCYLSLERQSALRARIRAILDSGLPYDPKYVDFFTQIVVFSEPDQVQSFVDQFNGNYPKLLIVDTLRRAFDGDERDNNLMTRWCQGVEMFRDLTGASVMVIHHNRRDQYTHNGRVIKGDYSGAGALLGSFDAQLSCMPQTNGNVQFKIDGANEGNNFNAFFKSEEVTVFERFTTWVMKDVEQGEKPELDPLVIEILKSNSQITQKRLLELCLADETISHWWPELNKSTISKIVNNYAEQIVEEENPDDGRSKLLTFVGLGEPVDLAEAA